MHPPPVAYFAFNRPHHAKRTLEALAHCHGAAETDIHVFVDAARDPAEESLVAEVIAVAEAVRGFRSVSIRAAASNLGLYKSVTEGVSTVLAEAGQVIVVEDDILVSPHFLTYMREALSRYQDRPEIGCIHAFTPPLENLPDYFFLRGADCWGWATWTDRWALFDPDAGHLLRLLVANGLLTEFCLNHGSHALLHLVRRKHGQNESWAALWHASLFLAGRFTLHPGRSFVQNIGNDGSGTHAAFVDDSPAPPRQTYVGLPALEIGEDREIARRMGDFLDGGESPRARIGKMVRRSYAKFRAMVSVRCSSGSRP